MPVIGLPVEELTSRIGRELTRDELLRSLQDIGCDVDGYELQQRARCVRCGWVHELPLAEEGAACERCGADLNASGALAAMPPQEVVRMDALAVRPDLFDPGGLARALRGILSVETGLKEYTAEPARLRLRVDPSVTLPSSLRPWIACAVLENVVLDENRIRILMKLQENLHWALGRDRKHASIGVYDLDSLGLTGSADRAGRTLSTGGEARGAAGGGAGAGGGAFDLEYTTEDPASYSFVPLGAPSLDPSEKRTLKRILEEHPKGIAYARLLAGFDRYPILRTASGRVLSMPPIINSEDTKVHPGSRNLFVDVTGSGERIVQRTLNILLTSYLELDGAARLREVVIEGPAGEARVTPALAPQEAWCDLDDAARMIGVDLSMDQLRTLLLRMRHGLGEVRGRRIQVRVPAYRNDILHEIDLIEDAAIAYGYANIPPVLVPTQTVGRSLEVEDATERARDVLVGLGLTEIMTLVLTSPETSDRLLGVADHPGTVLVENPISQEQVQLRTSLIPGVLATLAGNRHNPLPQGIFEVGEVTFLDQAAETGAADVRHLAFGLTAPRVGFAELRPLVEAFVRELGWRFAPEPHRAPFFLDGRGALLRAPAGEWTGVFGEVHPLVLEKLGLQNPTVVMEMVLPVPGVTGEYRSFPG